MSNTAVLAAAKSLIGAAYSQTYVYPVDYGSMADKPAVPFVVIEELPGVENDAEYVGTATCVWDSWSFGIFAVVSWGELPAPGTNDAAAKLLAYAVRDAIAAIIKANRTLNGTIKEMGDDGGLYRHMITPMQWNQKPAFGVFFEIPVRTE